MTQNLLTSYQRDGYLLLRGLLRPAELLPIQAQLELAVECLAQDRLAQGRIASTHPGLPFARRMAAISGGDDLGMRAWDDSARGPALETLIGHPAIARTVRGLLGGPVRSNGDFHVRPKLPGSTLTAFPWHQDSQYYGAPTAPLHVITAWLPLVPVDARNGCLQVIPGSHRWGLLGGDRGSDMNMRCHEDPLARGAPVMLEMQPGDVLLFHNLTVHGSEENLSDGVRWSLDFRYSSPVTDPALLDAETWFMDKLRGNGFLQREVLV